MATTSPSLTVSDRSSTATRLGLAGSGTMRPSIRRIGSPAVVSMRGKRSDWSRPAMVRTIQGRSTSAIGAVATWRPSRRMTAVSAISRHSSMWWEM